MQPAENTTFIATIADREGWLFEHVADAPSQAAAEAELREILRHWGMTLIEVRRAPTENAAHPPRTSAGRFIAAAIAVTALVSAFARVVVF
jgi:hypothetical protein